MSAQVRADQNRIKNVVDGADDQAAPDGEQSGFAPVAIEP